MNFSDAGYMFTNHIYGLSEENRMNRIRRMQQMLEAEKVDFALFIGRGFSGIATWFTGLPNPEFPDAGNGAFILPVQGELIDVGGNALLTEEYLKTLKTYDVIQPPHAEVAHLIGMGGFSGEQMRGLVGANRRVGVINGEQMRANLADYLAAELPNCELVDLTVQALRVMAEKSAEELEAERLCAKCLDRTFSALPLALQEGKTEREAVVKLRRDLLDFGAAGQEIAHIMPVWLTSAQQDGAAEAQPVAYPGRRFQDGDRINVSTIPALYSDYRVGLGRCFTLGGATEETKRFWAAAAAAQQAAENKLRDGVRLGDILQAADAAFASSGIAARFTCRVYEIGYEAVPLEDAKYRLCEGMTLVIAAEVQPEGQDAYCCMDTFAVENEKGVRLTETPREIIEMQNF